MDESYEVHCFLCKSTKHLAMCAHRSDGEMVGWIFVCKEHEEQVKDKPLTVFLGSCFDWMGNWVQAYANSHEGFSAEEFLNWVAAQPMQGA